MGFLGSPNCLKCPPDSARLSGVRFLLSSVILASALLVHFCWYLFLCFFLFLNACEIYSVLSLDFLFSYWQIFFFLLVYDFFSSSDIFCYDFFFRSLARAVFSSLFGCVLIFFDSKECPSVIFAHWYLFYSVLRCVLAGLAHSREYVWILACFVELFSLAFSILADITQNISRSLHIFANLKNFISTFFSPMSTATKSWRVLMRPSWGVPSEKSICCWFA